MLIIFLWLVLPLFCWIGALWVASAPGRPRVTRDRGRERGVVLEQFLVTGFILGNTPWVAAWLHIDLVPLIWAVLVFCGVHLAARMILSFVRVNRGPPA